MEVLEICQPCLDTLLTETDPQRRRTLATTLLLPTPVVERLASDRDEHVRARVAARSDLPQTLSQRFASNTEDSPLVWRALAGSNNAVPNAGDLVATGDPLTLATLAAHPDLDGELLDQLADHPDPDVSTSAIATRSGLRPDQTISQQVIEAARTDVRPIISPPKGTPTPIPIPSQSVRHRPSLRSGRMDLPSVSTDTPASDEVSPLSPPPPPSTLAPPPVENHEFLHEPPEATSAALSLGPSPVGEANLAEQVEVDVEVGDGPVEVLVPVAAVLSKPSEPLTSSMDEPVSRLSPLPELASPSVAPDSPTLLDRAELVGSEPAIDAWQESTSAQSVDLAGEPDASATPSSTGGRRSIRAMALAGAAVVLVAVIFGVTQVQNQPRSAPSAIPPTTIHRVAITATTLGSSTTSATTLPPSTQPPVPPTTGLVGPPPTAPLPSLAPPQPVAPAPIGAPPAPSGPVTRSIQVASASGQFCGSVRVTVNYSPSQATVTVTDDSDRQVGSWSGPSGQTHSLTLTRATKVLTVTVQANGTGLAVSASASGDSC